MLRVLREPIGSCSSNFFLKKLQKTTRPFLSDPLKTCRGNKISRAAHFLYFILFPDFV
jgi:hypothetical protein